MLSLKFAFVAALFLPPSLLSSQAAPLAARMGSSKFSSSYASALFPRTHSSSSKNSTGEMVNLAQFDNKAHIETAQTPSQSSPKHGPNALQTLFDIVLKPGHDYEVQERLGAGSQGEVFRANDRKAAKERGIAKVPVILKLESAGLSTLEKEYVTYKHLQEKNGKMPQGFMNVVSDGTFQWRASPEAASQGVLAMEPELGLSMQDYVHKHGVFDAYTLLAIGIQMIERIQVMHNKNTLHRGITPRNFLFKDRSFQPREVASQIVFVIDFGRSTTKWQAKPNRRRLKSFFGNVEFASSAVLDGDEYAPADDLEAIYYTLIWMGCGHLPWSHMGSSPEERKEVLNMKDRFLEKGKKKKYCANLQLDDFFVDLILFGEMLETSTVPKNLNYQSIVNMFKQEQKKHASGH